MMSFGRWVAGIMRNNMSVRPRLRVLSEGEGATFKYLPADFVDDDKSIENIPFVGTDGCIFCVGIYFPLNASKFFLAHIRPIVPGFNFLGQDDNYIHCNELQGRLIQQKTLQKLHQIEREEKWQIDRRVAKQGVVAVCPMVSHVDQYSRDLCAGLYILRAVREFLGSPGLQADRRAQGMYVDRRSRSVVKVAAGDDQRTPGFDATRQPEHCEEFSSFRIVREQERLDWDIKADEQENGDVD